MNVLEGTLLCGCEAEERQLQDPTTMLALFGSQKNRQLRKLQHVNKASFGKYFQQVCFCWSGRCHVWAVVLVTLVCWGDGVWWSVVAFICVVLGQRSAV